MSDIDFSSNVILDSAQVVISPVITSSTLTGIYGCVDAYSVDGISGWLFDACNPQESLQIGAYCQDILVANGVTSFAREDICAIMERSVLCGFVLHWNIDALRSCLSFTENKTLPIEVRFRGIPVYSIETYTTNDVCTWLPFQKAALIEGEVLSVRGATVYGKCCKQDCSSDPIMVQLQENNRIISSCISSAKSIKGSDFQEFFLRIPKEMYDDKKHTFHVCFKDGTPLVNGVISHNGGFKGNGAVEYIRGDIIDGWAFSCLAPLEPPVVDAYINGKCVGTATASRFRSDIAEAMFSYGFNAFTLHSLVPLTEKRHKQLEIRLRDSDTPLKILESAWEIDKTANDKPEFQYVDPLSSTLKWYIEAISTRYCHGWVLDTQHSKDRLVVDILVNGAIVTSTIADKYRKDLSKSLNTDGYHAFYASFPYAVEIGKGSTVVIRTRKHGCILTATNKMLSKIKISTDHTLLAPCTSSPYIKCSTISTILFCKERQEPLVDIIILNKDGEHHLENLFSSFYKFNSYKNFILTIVDHASVDDSRHVCRRWSNKLPIKCYNRGSNYSYSASNNFAADMSSADILLFLNNDIVFCQDIIEKMLEYIEKNAADIVGIKLQSIPLLLFKNSPMTHETANYIQHLGIQFSFSASDYSFGPYELPMNKDSLPVLHSAWKTPGVTAACMMMSAKTFKTIGGFHEGYFYGYEDVDLCLFAHCALGLNIVSANELTAYHINGASRKADTSLVRKVDASVVQRVSKNKKVLEKRFGAFMRGIRRHEWLQHERLFKREKPRFAFLVSKSSLSAAEGDIYTAYEFGQAFVDTLDVTVEYIAKEDWHDLAGVDVAICLIPDFEPELIRNLSPYLCLIAWPRNHFDTWLKLPHLTQYDEIWCASGLVSQMFSPKLGRKLPIVPIATNPERFCNSQFSAEFVSDYTFTGSFFTSHRQIMSCLHPEEIPYDFALYGHNWDEVERYQPYWRGALPYGLMPQVYASTKIVIDDANHTVMGWGGVNSRVFDALAAGALVITNTQTGSDALFDGLLPVYTTAEDLKKLLLHYLANDQERKELVKRLRSCVLAKHTYLHRVQEVYESLEWLGRALRVLVCFENTSITDSPLQSMLQKSVAEAGHRFRIPTDARREKTLRIGDDIRIDITPHPQDPGGDPSVMRCCFCLALSPEEEVRELAAYDRILVLGPSEKLCLPYCVIDTLFVDDAELNSSVSRTGYDTWHITNTILFQQRLNAWVKLVLEECHDRQVNPSRLPAPQRSRVQQELEHVVLKMSASYATVLFSPDYRKTNPYQTLLYAGLSAYFDIRPGTIDEALVLAQQGHSVVFHQHWTSVILGRSNVQAEVECKVNMYLSMVRQFIQSGGIFVWTVHNAISHEVIFPYIEAELCTELGKLASCIHVHSACVPNLLRPCYNLPDEKIFVGAHGHYKGVYPESVDVMGLREHLNIPSNARVFLFLGQVRAYKGIKTLLEAFNILSSTYDSSSTRSVWLIIAGQPVFTETLDLEYLAPPNCTLDLRIIPDDELKFFCDAADFMILPYRQVLTSGSVFLSLSCGLPVIAPRIGLLSEVVEDCVNGFLYDAEDSKALVKVMQQAVELTEQDCKTMREATLRKVETLTWDQAHNELSKVFATALGAEWEYLLLPAGQRRVLVRRPVTLKQSRVGVVILHYGHLEDTVRSAFSVGGESYLYLVSNDTDAAAFLALCRTFPDAIVIQSPDNIGYAAGNNLALRIIQQSPPSIILDYILLLNPDVVLQAGAIAQLVSHMDNDPTVSIAGPRIVFGDNPDVVWFGGGKISWTSGLHADHLYIGQKVSDLPQSPFTVDYITGACLLMRRNILEIISFLPEEYFLYFEETDWCLRAQNLGLVCKVFPAVEARHFKRSEEEGRPSNTFLYYYCRNSFFITAKYHPECVFETEIALRKKTEKWLNTVEAVAPDQLSAATHAVESGISDGKKGCKLL